MQARGWRNLGAAGAVLAALCCFTPLLGWFLVVTGLWGALGWLYSDAVLIPALLAFVVIAGTAQWLLRRKSS